MKHRLLVDWPRCQAEGLCHEVLPDVVRLDDWGYPVVPGEIDEARLADARAAARACPRLALRVASA